MNASWPHHRHGLGTPSRSRVTWRSRAVSSTAIASIASSRWTVLVPSGRTVHDGGTSISAETFHENASSNLPRLTVIVATANGPNRLACS